MLLAALGRGRWRKPRSCCPEGWTCSWSEIATNATERGNLLIFFSLTYAVMWALYFAVAYAVPANTPLGNAMTLLGAYAPGIVAVTMTVIADGSAGVRRLVAPVIKWRVGAQWYVFAATYVAGVKLLAALIQRAVIGEWPRFGTEPLVLIPLAIAVSTPFQAGEEIGWRGYALPRLADCIGLRWSAIVLGAIWGFWHIPQFFIRQADTYGQSVPVYVLQVVAISVTMTWLWARTGRSLLPVMLLHSAVNNSKGIVPSQQMGATDLWTLNASAAAWISVGILWAGATFFLAAMPSSGVRRSCD